MVISECKIQLLLGIVVSGLLLGCGGSTEAPTAITISPRSLTPIIPSPSISPATPPSRLATPSACITDLNTLQPGSTTNISCNLDLNNKKIVLPNNVKLNFAGGSITNGTLVFNNGIIDGDLLNAKLVVTGSAKLKNDVFNFFPARWNVVQGKINQSRAIENKNSMNKAINLVHKLGAKTFAIDNFDAYFYGNEYSMNPVQGATNNAINLPSNFHLKMSDKTFLRVQPSNNPSYRLLAVLRSKQVNISGGHLIGDRYQHDYSEVKDKNGKVLSGLNTHEFGALIIVVGGHDVVIDSVNMTDSSGDAVYISGTLIRNIDGSIRKGELQSERVMIKNSVLNGSRRNNSSVTDGDNITYHNNIISNAGGGTKLYKADGKTLKMSSAGTLPEAGIDVEAYREIDKKGGLLEYERATNINFINNTFIGNYVSDLVLFTTTDVLVEGNNFSNITSSLAASNVIIRNNIFKKGQIPALLDGSAYAMKFTSLINKSGENLVKNIKIHNNQISGYSNGAIIGGESISFHNNTISDFKIAVRLASQKNNKYYSNTFTSKRPVSYGYYGYSVNLENTSIYNEKVNVKHRPVDLVDINMEAGNWLLRIDNCNFVSEREILILRSNNIILKNSKVNTKIEVKGNKNTILQNNAIS